MKNNTKIVIVFLYIAFFNTSCIGFNRVFHKKQIIDSANVKLVINSNKQETADSILLTITLENNSPFDFWILPINTYKKIETSNYRNEKVEWGIGAVWGSLRYNEDSLESYAILKTSNEKMEKVRCKNYICLKSGDKYSFTEVFDFKSFFNSDISAENKDYGYYVISYTYHDDLQLRKDALLTPIESNQIKVLYKEQ